ncbi:MAG: hypothetical protein HYZ48_03335, partial [Chlamydiales bacterium]|nr:hypothetical protein [Chlamydiales bacterium]
LSGGSGNITLTGAGYSLTAGASGGTYNSAEILTPTAGGIITITSNNSPISLQAGGAATSDARIESLGSGNLQINNIGAFSATGGTNTSTTSRTIVATGLGGNITITASGNYTIQGGVGAADSRAGFYTGLSGGSGNITLTGAGYSLTAGGAGSLYNSAEIMTPLLGSGDITITSGAAPILLQGGGSTTSNARIITAGSGNISITGTGNLSALGGTGAGSAADINAQGTLTSNIGTGQYILTGNSGDSSFARFTAQGALNMTGANCILTAGSGGIADGSNTVIESTGAGGSVTLIAAGTGIVTLNAGTVADQNSYIQTTSGSGTNPVTVTCNTLNINGSTSVGATNASSKIRAIQGNIGVTASGDVNIAGGLEMGTDAWIGATAQGNISITANNLFAQGGSAIGVSGIETQSGDVVVNCVQDCRYQAPTATALAVMRTFGSDLTVTAGGSIHLAGHSIYSTPDPGHLLLVAGVNIELETSSVVHVMGNAGSSLTMIVDNNFPTAPSFGPGKFIIHLGAIVLTGGIQASVKIYTSTYPQNIVNVLLINLAPWVPGIEFINTAIQEWGVYAPGGTYGSYPFKFYYKNTYVTPPIPPIGPIGPSLGPYFDSVMANLVQLADLLPLLQALCRPHGPYHFQMCERDQRVENCDPIFSPYGSFIFEDDLYWIGTKF